MKYLFILLFFSISIFAAETKKIRVTSFRKSATSKSMMVITVTVAGKKKTQHVEIFKNKQELLDNRTDEDFLEAKYFIGKTRVKYLGLYLNGVRVDKFKYNKGRKSTFGSGGGKGVGHARKIKLIKKKCKNCKTIKLKESGSTNQRLE